MAAPTHREIAGIVRTELKMFSDGLEDRLADGVQKALDVVTAEYADRIRALEEDQARILRHLGLK